MNQVVLSPRAIAEKEWIEGSGVAPEIATLNIHTIENPQEIASLLNWKHYSGSGGWYVRSIDLATGQYSNFGQFKPEVPLSFPNREKAQKYISFPKGEGTEIILLLPNMSTWEAITQCQASPDRRYVSSPHRTIGYQRRKIG